MNVPDVVAEWSLSLASLVGVSGFAFLYRRANENSDKLLGFKNDSNERIDKLTDSFESLVKDLGNVVVYKRNCDDKQILWETKFAAIMEANGLQHNQILEKFLSTNEALTQKIDSSNKVFERQLEDLFDKMESLESCMGRLQQQRECD